jgi:hypothetical protein
MPSRDPSQPQRDGEISSSLRHRRRLRQVDALRGRPKRSPIADQLSPQIAWRQRASMITLAAYQRYGCSQSGSRLIVWPQMRHRKRRTQITIQIVSEMPRTWRE